MEKTIQRMLGLEQVNFFGVRHLSPASAFHMLRLLQEKKPKCVLVEGPSDANGLIAHIADTRIKPPFALLSYTTDSPVKTVMYPFAEYSPEYQAIKWALENGVKVSFIDLPTSAFIRLEARGTSVASDFYAQIHELAGESDYESFWERHFEHCDDTYAFADRMRELSETLRAYESPSDWENDKIGASYNLVREAYMKNRILQAVSEGYAADEITVITGAYHVSGLAGDIEPMTEKEIEALPREKVKMTLMPYSYYRLSSQSGYGAGNKAPEYFHMLWQCLQSGSFTKLPSIYLSSIGVAMRESGNYSSTANVIEAVRLSEGLASMRESAIPTLKDLHDSAVCLFGMGELATVAEAFAKTDIGTAIGELPEGLCQTPVQDDMNRLIKRLKLEKYKSTIAQELFLDLRENRKVKSEAAAFLDLNRSIFFNRLAILDIHFATIQSVYGASAWSEKWVLRWTPESEIEVVEATLKGETIENAAAFEIKDRLDRANDIVSVAKIMRLAFGCNLLSEVPNGVQRLQALCTEAGSFSEAAAACLELSSIIEYKDVRNLDTEKLVPILQQIFLRGSLILYDNAACDDAAAREIIEAIDNMHAVSKQRYEQINDEIWIESVRKTAFSDDRNAKVSGTLTALLLERNLISDEAFKTEMSRRLSQGVPSDIAAMWFEGLAGRNRYALLSRQIVWQQLDGYLDCLDDLEFRRSLVFLRRAFGGFSPKEKNFIIDILSDLWQVDNAAISEYLQEGLSGEEQEKINELNDFDFDDL